MVRFAVTGAVIVLAVLGLLALVRLVRRSERLGGMLISPGSTLGEVAAQPDWVVPLLMVLVSAVLLALAYSPRLAGFGAGVFVVGAIFTLLATAGLLLLRWCLQAGFIWLVVLIFGDRTRFYRLFSVVGYAHLPEMLGVMVAACAVAFMISGPESPMLTSVAGLFPNLDSGHASLRALFEAIELFNLWSLVLTVVGVQRVYGFRVSKAAVIVVMWQLLALATSVGLVSLGKV